MNTAQGATLVGVVLACILLFPMPLDSKGEILYAASTCYRRMWHLLLHALLRRGIGGARPEESQGPIPETVGGGVGAGDEIFHRARRLAISVGHPVRRAAFVECCLRLYVKYVKPALAGGKPGRGANDADVAYGTTHMRLAAITVVELAQDITGALVTAHGVPRIFDGMRV